MNFDYYKKVLALPVKSTMKGVLRTLAYHCNPKLDNRCIPSRKTIISESGVSSDTVGDAIRISIILGIITKRHRGDIETGKESDEYFFNFDGLGFYNNKGKWILPKNKLLEFKQNYAIAKQTIKDEDKLEGKKRNTAFPHKTRYQTEPIKPDTRSIESLKKPDTGMSCAHGLEGYSIKPDTRPIKPDTGTEVVWHNKKPSSSIANDPTAQSHIEKKQKTVLHDKQSIPFEGHNQDSDNNNPVKKKDPSKQTRDEWLADHENANRL